ncbi:hypothetical protein O3P69_020020 [Scylla paramamosain]|uniref:Uncharacterized protein n=1 Tax=Scylla paramamosain TaxID=85552 RepID=A0AAW0TJB8_SCYPA
MTAEGKISPRKNREHSLQASPFLQPKVTRLTLASNNLPRVPEYGARRTVPSPIAASTNCYRGAGRNGEGREGGREKQEEQGEGKAKPEEGELSKKRTEEEEEEEGDVEGREERL